MTTATIQRYRDIEGAWRWRLIGADGHPLADGERPHPDESALTAELVRLRATLPEAAIVDDRSACPDDPPACVVRVRGDADEWRWQLYLDGTHVADSGEGYADTSALERAIERTQHAIDTAPVTTWDP